MLDDEARVATSEPDNSRVLAISDGVFAVAITLLIFNIQAPTRAALDAHHGDLARAVGDLGPEFQSYAISFLVIASYWIAHHRIFRAIRTHDGGLIWLNFVMLLLVGFLPFPTSLLGAYPDDRFAVIFYAACMAATSTTVCALWLYATHDRRLIHRHVPDAEIRRYTWRTTIVPLIFLASIPLSYASLDAAKYAWVLIFFTRVLVAPRRPPDRTSGPTKPRG